jgi:hypothetical protein
MLTGPDAEEMFQLPPTTPNERAGICQNDNRCTCTLNKYATMYKRSINFVVLRSLGVGIGNKCAERITIVLVARTKSAVDRATFLLLRSLLHYLFRYLIVHMYYRFWIYLQYKGIKYIPIKLSILRITPCFISRHSQEVMGPAL